MSLVPELARTPPRFREMRRLFAMPAVAFASAVLVIWITLAVAWPVVVPYDPLVQELTTKFLAPSFVHPFGTDNFGRDVFSRVLAGSRTALTVSAAAALLAVAVGTAIGLAVGYYGGKIGELAMRAIDLFMALPVVVLALIVLAALGPSTVNVVLVIAFVFVPYNARVIRAAVLAVREHDYVAAARLRGEGAIYVMTMEILPNITGTLLVELTIRLAYAIFSISTLSFLGMGIQPPAPEWGLMVAEGRGYYRIAPWIVLFPSLSIASLVISVNLLAERLR